MRNNKEDLITFLIAFDLTVFNKIYGLELVIITSRLF